MSAYKKLFAHFCYLTISESLAPNNYSSYFARTATNKRNNDI